MTEFSEKYTDFLLLSARPITVATVERTLSKLEIIEDCKRNSIGKTSLRDLAILSIQHAEGDKMDLNENLLLNLQT